MSDVKALSDQDLHDELDALAEWVAEDSSERALFGDGPCGSQARAARFNALNREANRRANERLAAQPRPAAPAIDPNDIPF